MAWASSDLLNRLRLVTGRPVTDAALTDTMGYLYLSDAQREVAYTMAQQIPWVNYSEPVQMVTTDNKVFTLPGGTGAEWIGRILVMRTLDGEPLIEGGYDDCGAEFTMEGPSSIRITGNRTWTGAAPYVRYMPKPGDLDGSGSNDPILLPLDVRQAVVYIAAAMWAGRGGYRDPEPYRREAYAILWGRDGFAGHPGLIPSYKQAQMGSESAWVPWYRMFSAR